MLLEWRRRRRSRGAIDLRDHLFGAQASRCPEVSRREYRRAWQHALGVLAVICVAASAAIAGKAMVVRDLSTITVHLPPPVVAAGSPADRDTPTS